MLDPHILAAVCAGFLIRSVLGSISMRLMMRGRADTKIAHQVLARLFPATHDDVITRLALERASESHLVFDHIASHIDRQHMTTGHKSRPGSPFETAVTIPDAKVKP